jgi:hypothetical protein
MRWGIFNGDSRSGAQKKGDNLLLIIYPLNHMNGIEEVPLADDLERVSPVFLSSFC